MNLNSVKPFPRVAAAQCKIQNHIWNPLLFTGYADYQMKSALDYALDALQKKWVYNLNRSYIKKLKPVWIFKTKIEKDMEDAHKICLENIESSIKTKSKLLNAKQNYSV